MKKESFIFNLVIAILWVLILGYTVVNKITMNNNNKIVQISIILNEPLTTYWESVKLGVNKAALDNKAEISFKSMINQNDVLEQKEILKREIENGADAIIVVPTDESIFEYINKLNSKITVIEMGSNTSTIYKSSSIYPDNKKMSESIGEEILSFYNQNKHILLLDTQNKSPISLERKKAFTDFMKENNILIDTFSINNDIDTSMQDLKLELSNIDALVALDENEILLSCKAISLVPDCNTKVFGIDSNPLIVSYIENNIIDTTIAQNTFTLGYLSVEEAVKNIKGYNKNNSIEIEFTKVKLDNLFTSENQRLLFPFIK